MHKKMTGYTDTETLKLCYCDGSDMPYSYKASESMFEYSIIFRNNFMLYSFKSLLTSKV